MALRAAPLQLACVLRSCGCAPACLPAPARLPVSNDALLAYIKSQVMQGKAWASGTA